MTTTEAAPQAPHEVDFDHHSPSFRDDNKAAVRALHATGCPLGHSPRHGGFWAVYGYDAVNDAVHDTELYSSAHTPEHPKGVPSSAQADPLIPIDVDGPLVQEY